MATANINLQLNEIVTAQDLVHRAEQQLKETLGLTIFDYAPILTPEVSYQIELNITSDKIRSAVQTYLDSGEKYLQLYNIKPDPSLKKIEDQFFGMMHDIYSLRFIESKALFGQYQLVRIMNQLEDLLFENYKFKQGQQKLPFAITIAVPNAFVLNDTNDLDVVETIKHEKTTHVIGSSLSLLPHLSSRKTIMYNYFRAHTTKGMVPRLYKNEITDCLAEIAEAAFLFFTPSIYNYIDKGLPPKEAKANVKTFLTRLIEKNSGNVPKELKDLFTELETTINASLNNLKELYPETRNIVMKEMLDLMLVFLAKGAFIPVNYYDVVIREPKENSLTELGYSGVMDLYLHLNHGERIPMAIETYAIDFTEHAKNKIFRYVTNGFENPYFTLTDFMDGR